MSRAIAINGSPHKHKGNTGAVLTSLIQGMTDAGCNVDLVCATDLKVRSCACENMYCWYNHPGECCIKDDMEQLYPRLRAAELLVLATPVYIPLPGEMQNIINRLCPLIVPRLENRDGRTRAKFRDDVAIEKILLVVTGGWWERENAGVIEHVVRELAENASVEFAGAVVRPHADMMKFDGKFTEMGTAVLEAARTAGRDLIQKGHISQETLDAISQPLIPEEAYRQEMNSWVR